MSGKRKSVEALTLQEIFDLVMDRGIEIGRKIEKDIANSKVNYYKATEDRLSTLASLKAKVREQGWDIEELIKNGRHGRSKDICLYTTAGGEAIPEEEVIKVLVTNLKKKARINQRAIKEVEVALELIKKDEYYKYIEGRYFKNKSDAAMAKEDKCDLRTVWSNRSRLVKVVAVRLYGADALEMKEES